MDPRLLTYYQKELQHIREMGGEFAREYPKIAGRLGLEGFECADPYVERLLEGFAFLAARVQLKLDSEFPQFTRHLLEMVYPHYLAPTPSMAVVRLEPDLTEGALNEGFPVPRHTVLRSPLGKGEQTACEYRTAHDVTLWPLKLIQAEYFTHARALGEMEFPRKNDVKAGIRLRLHATAGQAFEKLSLESLPLFLLGADEQPMHLYEQLIANAVAVIAMPTQGRARWREVIDASHIRQIGLEDHEALLPYGGRSFHGYRLLQEYFAFHQRFLFVELGGLGPAVRRCKETELDLIVLLDRLDPYLQNAIDVENFAMFCTPTINLFPKRPDRIHLESGRSEYHIVPDRTRPMDFEIVSVNEVVGHGTTADERREFRPFYASNDRSSPAEPLAYYTTERQPRVLSAKQRRSGPRSSYVGSEIFLSLVDARQAPFSGNLKQLSLSTLCTNRDLPLHMAVGSGSTDFTLESGAPVESVRCVAGPSPPFASHAEGEIAWRLISHLSLNYLSLVDSDAEQGAAGLRDLLELYGNVADATIRRQVDGVRSIESRPVTRRLPLPGPIVFGRGLQLTLALDEAAFEGTGEFLLGAVLDRFFAKYVSINSFTETVVKTLSRGEIHRWPTRLGQRRRL